MKKLYIGIITKVSLLFLLVITASFSAKLFATESTDLVGTWEGELQVANQAFPLVLHINLKGQQLKATLDSPAQGAKDIPVTSVKLSDESVIITISAAQATFEALLSSEKDVLDGTWKQGPNALPLSMKKVLTVSKTNTIKRPQNPKGPYNYDEEIVTFRNDTDQINLTGTLTVPKGNGVYPAVVMITGSGPQDRDQTFMGHKTFWVIADFLSRNGIVVLRYDDRGIGESEGVFSQATSLDFANDASAAVEYLAKKASIDPKKIGLIGHSEGGLIAPLTADMNDKVAFILSLAGPGTNGNEIAVTQIRDSLLMIGVSARTATAGSGITRQLNKTVLENTNPDQLKDELISTYKRAWNTLSDDVKAQLQAIGGGQLSEARIEQLSSNWTKFFLQHDPSIYLKKLTIPVYAIHGDKDTQLNAKTHMSVFENILNKKNKLNEFQIIPGHNHLFQPSKTGLMTEYVNIETTISEDVLNDMLKWIRRVV